MSSEKKLSDTRISVMKAAEAFIESSKGKFHKKQVTATSSSKMVTVKFILFFSLINDICSFIGP